VTGLMVGVSAVMIAMRFNSVGSSTLGVNTSWMRSPPSSSAHVDVRRRGTVWGTVVGAITLV